MIVYPIFISSFEYHSQRRRDVFAGIAAGIAAAAISFFAGIAAGIAAAAISFFAGIAAGIAAAAISFSVGEALRRRWSLR